jgi:CRISPR-associated protein Csx17
MPEVILAGCTPEPLMGYLKALGAFRLVAEQADRTAKMSWAGGACHLHSSLDRNGLTDFLLNRYHPTPILAPWNGGSGFYGGGSGPLDAIRNSSVARLGAYRATIEVVRKLIPQQKPKDEEKQALLTRCRAELPDGVVPWLDTCFALGEDGPSYFPLLGTGGNDGRLDFTNNFFQRLADAIPFKKGTLPSGSAGWLASALFADDPELTALGKAAVGQFNPGGIGGANGVQGDFEAGSRVNPWDFILMIEGTLLFAGSVARRLGANAAARVVFPFTVSSVAVGYGSAAASEETTDGSRAELWLPLWNELAGLPEVRQLFAEGRAQVGRRQARNAVEFALAACMLGVSRGVQEFARYGFLKRNGLAFLAAPLGRVAVTPRPAARLLDDPPLTDWIDRLRSAFRDKDKTPARYQSALRNIDRAMFEFAVRSQTDETADTPALIRILRALGRAERTLAGGLKFCKDNYIHPLNGLNPQWLFEAAPEGDAGREFRLAAALASVMAEKRKPVGPLRAHLEEVEQKRRRVDWKPGSTSAVWTNRTPSVNLAAVLVRRWMESERAGTKGLALRARVFAPLADVVAFLHGQTDDELLADLLWALIGLKWNAEAFPRPQSRVPLVVPPPPEFSLIRLVLRPVRLAIENRPDGELSWRAVQDREQAALVTTPSAGPFQRLSRGNLSRAVAFAARRLWSDRLVPFGWANRRQRQDDYPTAAKLHPVRLLAACLFPLSGSSLTRLARQALSPPVPVS